MPRFTKDRYCVLRSGAWDDLNAKVFRAHYPVWCGPNYWFYNQGFRCVTLVDSPTTKKLVRIK